MARRRRAENHQDFAGADADKVEMLAAAMNDLNWKTATHHEADAGAVGLCAYERLFPKAAAA